LAPHQYADRSIRGMIISTIVITIAIIVVFGLAVMGIDYSCQVTIETWTPYYPDAEVVSVEYDLFRPRAMGNSLVILSTPDEYLVVNEWYQDHQANLREMDQVEGIATYGFNVRNNPDSDGSLIYLFSECAYN